MQTWCSLLFIVGATVAQTPTNEPGAPVGKAVAAFKLQDYRGAWHSLNDFSQSKLIVVAFLGAECPLANRYAPRLAELAEEFTPRGVAFLGVDANRQDSLAHIARQAKEYRIPFPVLKDVGNAVADRFGAARTPEVFVLDDQHVVRYRGRIDDQYGVGYARPHATRRDLAVALEELLAGKPVSQPVTEAAGCLIGRVRRPAASGEVTYARHIARVFEQRCVTCHHAGSVAPFALTSYREAVGWAETIREVIAEQRMPPWHANPQYGSFANDARMPEEEKRLVLDWVRNGAPEGDPKDLPPAQPWVEGWRIPKPDLVIDMPQPFAVPAEGTVRYQYFTVDPGFREDRWVKAAEARPGNRAVVHHLLVFIEAPGGRRVAQEGAFGSQFVAAGVPGMPPLLYGEGEAKFIPAGSRLVFQVHYTPNGTAQTDRSQVGLVFADPKTVKREIRSEIVLNHRFRIPPGVDDYPVEAAYQFRQDTLLYSLMPHMHLRGKSFRFEAVYPDQRREVLLDVPRYSFDWQNLYVLARPKLMPEGTVLHCSASFDNSEKNLSNPDPKKTVTFGDQTWEEMMVGYFDTALAYQDLGPGPPQVKPLGEGKYEATFRYQAPPGTKAVYLAGTFNDWKPTAHRMDGPDDQGVFTTRLTLKGGRHEYKYVLEGKTWRADPANREQTGFYNNSVLVVPDSR
jgi:peroxiredoxin